MNKSDFLGLIGSNGPVDRQVLAEISEMVSIFPYFQTAHLLLLKGLKDNSDIRFENQLRNSAIHISDREVLFNLLKIAPIRFEQVAIKEPEEEPVPEKPPEEELIIKEPRSEESIKEEPVTEEPPAETPAIESPFSQEFIEEPVMEEAGPEGGDIEQTVIESAKNSDDFITEIERDFNEKPEEQSDSAEKLLERINLGSSELESEEPEIDEPLRGALITDDVPVETEEEVFYMDPGFSFAPD